MNFFNQLTPPELERLALLSEELGEAQWAIGKILRHGFESTHPDGGPTNREILERELGHVRNAQRMMVSAKDISWGNINIYQGQKQAKIAQYLHHQTEQPAEPDGSKKCPCGLGIDPGDFHTECGFRNDAAG